MTRLVRFSISAIAGAVIALIGASVLVFAAIHLIPGSYADAVLPTEATSHARALLEHQLGLNEPLPFQYAKWFSELIRGNLGVSLTSGESVGGEIASHAPPTIELTLIATLLSVLVGIPLGAAAAFGSNRRVTSLVMRTISSLALGVPNFVLGVAIAYIASVHFLGLSIPVYVPFTTDPLRNIGAVLLPGIVLGVFPTGFVARTTRDAILDVLTKPFVTAAVARGETPVQIARRHVLRNAINPVITVVAVDAGYLLGGAVIIENIFSIPGLGQYALTAIQNRDYSQVEGVVMVGTVIFIVLNLVSDLAYAIVDPRISLVGRER